MRNAPCPSPPVARLGTSSKACTGVSLPVTELSWRLVLGVAIMFPSDASAEVQKETSVFMEKNPFKHLLL